MRTGQMIAVAALVLSVSACGISTVKQCDSAQGDYKICHHAVELKWDTNAACTGSCKP